MLKKQLKYIALPIILICSGCDEYIDLKLNTKDIESVVASGNSWRFSLYVLVNTLIPPDNHDFVSSRRCSFTLNQAK